jgi:hypothetical protein
MTVGISSLVILGTLILVIKGIFELMENTANPSAKRSAADWIKSIAAKSTSQTIVESPRWFIVAFDRIFGDRHLTWRCFLRSCVASMIAVFVMTVMWAVLDTISWQQFLLHKGIDAFSMIFILAFFLNLVPDYISLLETRWIFRKVAHAGMKELIVLLVLDVIITGGIFVCGIAIILILISSINGDPAGVVELVDRLPEILSELILFRTVDNSPAFGIFFYSTYFTSVWLYLFISASIATKILYSLGRTGNQVLALLKVEEKPFNSMGLLLIGLLTLAFAIYAIIGAIV